MLQQYGFTACQIETQNVSWRVFIKGDASAKPLLMMHGFPDTPESFRHQFDAFEKAGFQLIVPYMPGYSDDGFYNGRLPEDSPGGSHVRWGVDYYPGNFGRDIHDLILAMHQGEIISQPKVHYLGHDWGGFAGSLLALHAPESIERMVLCAMPGLQGMKHDLLQQAYRSRYIMKFQLGDWMNQRIRNKQMTFIDDLYSEWSPEWQQTETDQQAQARVKAFLGQPGQLERATGYYRSAVKQGSFDPELKDRVTRQIEVPTMILAGRSDGCIGLRCFYGQEAGFNSTFEFRIIEGAGHFMHAEKPEVFNHLVTLFLSR